MKSKLDEEKKLKEERSQGTEGLVAIKKSCSWGSWASELEGSDSGLSLV